MEMKKCKFCDKEIEGFTEGQVDYLMNQHILSKHKDKFEVSEK